MSIPKSTRSVRPEVQPALSPSGLQIQAHAGGMSIPHGDYRAQPSGDIALITAAFGQLAQVASEVAREQIVEQRKADQALGLQGRLEAGDNADRAIDTKDKSEYYIKGYDLMSGQLGAAKAGADLQQMYDNNPDAFVTQGMLQGEISARIKADLQGVDSPEMRAGYLQHMVNVEADLTAKNAKYQAIVAHTEQLNNFNSVIASHATAGIDGKSVDDIALDVEAMTELGRVNGLSADEVNTSIIKTYGEIAVKTGRPDLMKAFDQSHPDVKDPSKTIPGLRTSAKWRDAINEYEAQATTAQAKFERDNLEKRQYAAMEGIDAEPNYSVKLKMIKDRVDDGTFSAEKGWELRGKLEKAKAEFDTENVLGSLADEGQHVVIAKLAAEGAVKEKVVKDFYDKRDSRNLTFFHQMQDKDPATAAQAMRQLVAERKAIGRKSDVLERELNPAATNRAGFVNAIEMYNYMQGQGDDAKAIANSHMNDDMRGRMQVYQTTLRMTQDPDQAYASAISYGSAESIKQGNAYIGQKGLKAVDSVIDDKLGTFDPGIWHFEYDMVVPPEMREDFNTRVRIRVQQSGGMLDPEEVAKDEAEKAASTHTAYKVGSEDKGRWVYTPTGADQQTLQKAFDWYGKQVAAQTGYPEGSEFYPEYQQGVGHVMHEANTGRVVMVSKAIDMAGNTVSVPLIVDPVDVMGQYEDTQHLTAEQLAAQQANRQTGGSAANPAQTRRIKSDHARAQLGEIKARTNAPQYGTSKIAPRSRARTGGSMMDANTQYSTGGSLEQVQQQPSSVATDFIANEENSIRKGFDKGTGKWSPHTSLEGGNPTIAYGHKITKAEKSSGVIKIGGQDVKIADGLTEGQAKQLLDQDTTLARSAVESLVKVPLNENQKAALTSLIYNVGVDSFKGSNALKALNKGDMKTFREEAFGSKGWINYKGHPGGLKDRRKREEDLFFK